MKVFDLVLMLPEGHKQINAMNVKYEEICGGSGPPVWNSMHRIYNIGNTYMGSGPLLESCRPQLGVHKMAHQNPWECHFVHPQGAKKNGSCTKWGSPCRLEWFGCVQNGLTNPQMQSLYKMGIVDSTLIVQNGSLVGCSKWGAPTLSHQSSWSQISLYKMWMTNP